MVLGGFATRPFVFLCLRSSCMPFYLPTNALTPKLCGSDEQSKEIPAHALPSPLTYPYTFGRWSVQVAICVACGNLRKTRAFWHDDADEEVLASVVGQVASGARVARTRLDCTGSGGISAELSPVCYVSFVFLIQ